MYFKSRLIPESGHGERSDDESIIALRLFESDSVDSDHYRHTNAIFDETQDKELTKRINSHLERELFSISPELYPFLVYDYFTACLSVPKLTAKDRRRRRGFRAPFSLHIQPFRNIGDLVNAEMLSAEFRDQLEFREAGSQ